MKPVCVSTWSEPRKYLAGFLETSKRNGIEPVNADPEKWPGKDWTEIPWWRKSDAQARFIREHANEYTHFLFTDSYDILFATGWTEIIEKFNRLDCPIVFGAERYPWPKPEQEPLYPSSIHKTRFLNAGMWMATAEYALKLAEILAAKAKERKQCDQGICVDLFLSKQLPICLDTSCSMLFCCNLDSMDHLRFYSGRIQSLETSEYPCMFHGNGNANLLKLYPWLKL